MSTISLTNFDPRIAEAQRQQKLAEMLQAQAAEPLQPIGSYQGIQAPISPLAGLAKMLTAYAGVKKAKAAAKEQDDIAQAQQQQRMDAIDKLTSPTQSNLINTPADLAHTVAGMQPAGNGGLLAALKGAVGGGNAPQPGPYNLPPQAQPPGPPAAAQMPAPAAPAAPAVPAMAAATPPAPTPAGPVEAAPDPQSGPAQVLPTLQHATTPQERQQMSLQAMASGDPTLTAIGSHFFDKGEKDQTKADDAAKIKAAVANMPFSEPQKALIGQLGELGGSDAAMKGVEAFLKPADQTEMTKNYNEAVKQGYTGSFMDFMAYAKPQVTVLGQGQQAFQTRELTGQTPPPGGNPAAIGQQISAGVSAAIPGVKITSMDRTPAHNAAVGGVANSYHLEGAAVDFVPPQGMTMAQLEQGVRQTVGPGFQVINEGSHIHVEPGPSMGVPHEAGPVKPVASVAPRPVSAGGGAWSLSPPEQQALNTAVGEGRIDLKGLNSRTAKISAQALLANPGLNALQLHAVANVTANPAFQQRAKALEALPSSLKLVMDAGQKLNFSNWDDLGKVQAWLKTKTNDPDFRNYIGKRNDALQRLAYAMRGVGMSDNAVNLELQSAPVAMSPRAFQAWYDGQIEMVNKQLSNQAVFQVVGPNKDAPKLAGKELLSAADAILAGK